LGVDLALSPLDCLTRKPHLIELAVGHTDC
jgi:hypothetical protein